MTPRASSAADAPDEGIAALDIPKAQLKRMNREAWKRTRSSPQALVIQLAVILPGAICGGLLVHWLLPQYAKYSSGVIIGLSIASSGLALGAAQKRSLRAVLRENGYEVCEGCGYSLAQLEPRARKCPECGAARKPMTLSIERAPAHGHEARAIMQELDNDLRARYPGCPIYGLHPGEERSPLLLFFVLRTRGQVAACGALRLQSGGIAEIKRMFVRPAFRRKGYARAMLLHLEVQAELEHVQFLRLETGVGQPEALALYRSSGYTEIPKFGEYLNDPHSLCFHKDLRALEPAPLRSPATGTIES